MGGWFGHLNVDIEKEVAFLSTQNKIHSLKSLSRCRCSTVFSSIIPMFRAFKGDVWSANVENNEQIHDFYIE